MSASIAEVSEFLKEFKQEVTAGGGLYVIQRVINTVALVSLGLTERNRKQEILCLSVQDYCSGPKVDTDRPGEIWIFGRTIGGNEVYIKLKLAEVNETKIAKCLSFHAAEYPLTYAFKSR